MNTVQPHLIDARGKLVIGPARTPAVGAIVALGATSCIYDNNGRFAGVYVDNETPNRDAVAKKIVAEIPDKLVVVGLYPAEPTHRIPGCVCAYEWYPFHEGWGMPTKSNMGIPLWRRGPAAWILQWNFGWGDYTKKNDPPPTVEERTQLLNWVKRHHPLAKQIWLY